MALLLIVMIAAPAEAFHCGSKLLKVGMHSTEVVAICGEPASRRHLGYALRRYDFGARRRLAPRWTDYHNPGYGQLSEELIITEYVYNFGPRKLMRRLIFEGGILVRIETLGYGYRK